VSIEVLSQSLVNKIAAGEVIERPASVVKELVENSIDARAGRIVMELEGGGAHLMRVTDDGCGMDERDLALAFSSHATSKLQSEEDLFAIETMGFRGEALPSIGAVARCRVTSRTAGNDQGHEISISGGETGRVKVCGAPVGTQVEVRDLFYNVPVRKKFLKSTATEMAHVSEAVTRLALGCPLVHFVLLHNGREVFNLPPAQSRRQRLAEFFGREIAENIIPVQRRETELEIEGYLLPPSVDRASTKLQYTFVNNRYVRDRTLNHAIHEGYQGLMLPGRRPVCFIFIAVPPSRVDVNVHPAKIEVKFRESREVHSVLLQTIRETLRGARLTPPAFIAPSDAGQPGPQDGRRAAVEGAISDFFSARSGDKGRESARAAPTAPAGPQASERPVAGRARTAASARSEQQAIGRNCGQFLDAYIVEETEEGINIIDQHALHERLLYEKMKAELAGGPLNSQQLLVPELVELPAPEFYAVMGLQEHLQRFGFAVEAFGERTVIVRSFAQILGRFDGKAFFEEVLDELEGCAKMEERIDGVLKVMACRGAVKAGQRLSAEQLRGILQMRDRTDGTASCPHGRPTAIFLSRADLDRRFKRT